MTMLVSLMLTTLLLALSMGLVVVTNIESAVSVNWRRGAVVLYAAEAGLEAAIARLESMEWTGALNAAEPVGCAGPDNTPLAPTGFASLMRWGPNSPIWRLHDCSRAAHLLPPGAADPEIVVPIWVADDPSETDGDPLADTNGRLTVRAEAHARGGAHAAVEATLARIETSVRTLSWRILP